MAELTAPPRHGRTCHRPDRALRVRPTAGDIDHMAGIERPAAAAANDRFVEIDGRDHQPIAARRPILVCAAIARLGTLSAHKRRTFRISRSSS
jgi:hypothetical protein